MVPRVGPPLLVAILTVGCDGSPAPTIPEVRVEAPGYSGLPPAAGAQGPESVPPEPNLRPWPQEERPFPGWKALEWLARHQTPDGTWEAEGRCPSCDPGPGNREVLRDHEVGRTALALLSFMDCGESRRSPRFGETVRLGLRHLKVAQDAEGCFDPRSRSGDPTDHALATMAMVDDCSQAGPPRFEESARKALSFLLSVRNPGGGWGHSVGGDGGNIEATVWSAMAVRGAQRAHLVEAPGVLEKVRAWLESEPSLVRPDSSSEEKRDAAVMRACTRMLCGAKRGDAEVEAVADEVGDYLRKQVDLSRPPSVRTLYFGTWLLSSLSAHGVHMLDEREKHGGLLPGTRRWFRWLEQKDGALTVWLHPQSPGCDRWAWESGGPWPGRTGATALAAIAAWMN